MTCCRQWWFILIVKLLFKILGSSKRRSKSTSLVALAVVGHPFQIRRNNCRKEKKELLFTKAGSFLKSKVV